MVFNRKSSFFGSFSLISFCNIEFAKREEEKIAFSTLLSFDIIERTKLTTGCQNDKLKFKSFEAEIFSKGALPLSQSADQYIKVSIILNDEVSQSTDRLRAVGSSKSDNLHVRRLQRFQTIETVFEAYAIIGT